MLAYAPRSTTHSGSPRTLVLVAAGHAVALALALTARSQFAERSAPPATDVIFVPTKPPPPPAPTDPVPPTDHQRSVVDTPPVIIPTPLPNPQPLSDGPPVTSTDPIVGNAVDPGPIVLPDPPRPVLVRKGPRFVTPADLVRPPYPRAKQQSEESASLRLTLAIDARGRVTAVTPVGQADPMFLDAARRHILRHWRYQPAMEGDAAIPSSVTITLKFELED
jgi:protein TonB